MSQVETKQIAGIGQVARRAGANVADNRTVINIGNFTAMPVEDRYGDHYLGQLESLVTGEGEIALVSSPLPGHQEFLRNIGVAGEILEMPHIQHSSDPYDADPLVTLGRLLPSGSVLRNATSGQRYVLNPIFVTPEVTRRAREIGIEVLSIPISMQTNDKARLRSNAGRFGVKMFPGEIFSGDITAETIARILQGFGSFPQGVWIKLGQGSGGDSVFRVQNLTEEALRETIQKARNRYKESMSGNTEGWPEGQIAPINDALIVEADAENFAMHGSTLLGSNFVINGSMVGTFEQITDNGSFVGSRTVGLTQEQSELLEEQVVRVTEYMESIGFPYPFGMDYIFYINMQEELEIAILEVNARLPISGFAWWVTQQLGAEGFYNSNITLPRAVSDFSEVRDMLTLEDGENLLYDSQRGWGIVPAAFRSIPGTPSPHAKFFIVGSDEEQAYLRGRMLANNIRLGVL